MSLLVRDGHFDVAIVAGPRINIWPSVGVRVISALCAESGLTVGVFGGANLQVRGVMPLVGTGGLVLAEDAQHRLHRIRAKSIVRVNLDSGFPDPFPGWRSPSLIPLQTAERLFKESKVSWEPMVAILGTGNRALQFGSKLLASGVRSVVCIEPRADWGGKRFAGWEVEKRRFETGGGRILEVKPGRLSRKSALLWEFRVEDGLGVRILEVSHVVAAGPFIDQLGTREHPPGSLLFEMDQTAAAVRSDDAEGYAIEEERARLLGIKIVKALSSEEARDREELERLQRRARTRLKFSARHRENPFVPSYQGKWMVADSALKIRKFAGVPQTAHRSRLVASLECIEEIPCNLCEKACPESAIRISRSTKNEGPAFLVESDCTACGLCLPACPSGAALLVREEEERSFSRIVLPWKGRYRWKKGEFAVLLNRRGDPMGTARVTDLPEELTTVKATKDDERFQLVQLEVPTHLLWEARGIRRSATAEKQEEERWREEQLVEEKWVHITLDGEKRLARENVPVSVALFEMGQNRLEDSLLCPDGSCQLCHISVDGVKKLACQTRIRRGMALKLDDEREATEAGTDRVELCSCEGISREEVVMRLHSGQLRSVDAVLSAVCVGSGKCHGQLCMGSFKRLLAQHGIDAQGWVDWRFPWTDWVVSPGS